MPPPIPAPIQQAPPTPAATFATFSGLKNTVGPENLTARELARARNVDLDDLGALHRRRGRRQLLTGNCHSVFTTANDTHTFLVRNGVLVRLMPDGSTRDLSPFMADEPLAWIQVGDEVFFSSRYNSGRFKLATLEVAPWCYAADHAYEPSTQPDPRGWWYSPVGDATEQLGAVGGRLLGAPPFASVLGHFNGRIYLGDGPVLWATELYAYGYVDKTKGYRQFESDITGIQAVEDGVYVGTTTALYFLAGQFNDHVRTMRENSGVIPGTMIEVPGELIDPEGRRFPDLPRQTQRAMACWTNAGVIAGMPGGQTYNLTRTQVLFPRAVRGAAMMRREDGMNTLVGTLDSGGTPTDNARFGDHLSAVLIRKGSPGQP